MKKINFLLVIALLLILLTSCAHTESIQQCLNTSTQHGFWFGLWNGMTAAFTFIGSLFNHNIAVYAVNNNGGWYNFGFLLGVGGSCGSSVRFSKRKNNGRIRRNY